MNGAPFVDFDYSVMTERNAGFVTAEGQRRLRAGAVFVCGVGGMGGAALIALVRAGVGNVAITDPDRFELSNLNRQLLATLDTVGKQKALVARDHVHLLNPEARVATWGDDWVDRLDEILPAYPLVVNGMDDVRAAIQLYRKAREHRVAVIDAYTAPMPSLIRVGPDDPRPEERLDFPSLGRDPATLSAREIAECARREIEFVITHTSALAHFDARVAVEVLDGLRARPSFAPVVLTAGQLMAGEALSCLLGRPTSTDHRGWFLDPWNGRIERPCHDDALPGSATPPPTPGG
ncbi:MAG: ThiF family adenylyltransferase [Gemmatimonadota bacterium]